jgi:iron complex outermembrane recepter protein
MRHIRQFFTSTAIAATAIAALTIATPAFAQDETVADDSGLEEIVVTAQRREENLQDVPLSVTAVSGDKLDAISAGGVDVRGISGRVPSLLVESSFGRTFPRFYIRGLGNTDFDFNASQPVSLVYDDVVLENPILKGFPVFDLDRIEVLRGPQGTLFGRNTPAGIVKFDSEKPSDVLWPVQRHQRAGCSRRPAGRKCQHPYLGHVSAAGRLCGQCAARRHNQGRV